ncbi:MAG: hypothetical protein ABSG68_06490 [Thermoguttaceae bacterium]|jgi:hypothetical protein
MTTTRFTADIREDQTIRPPAGVRLALGKAEVVVFQPADVVTELAREDDSFPAAIPDIAKDLAQFAAEHNAQSLPPDLAINHDHYLHGAPKRVDQP